MQRLRLFGGITIEMDGVPLAGRAVQRRRLALLAFLAATRARGGTGEVGVGVSRDKLIALLWPTADAENGRHYLSDSIYRINDALHAEVITGEGDALRLVPEALPSDLADFRDALASGDHGAAVNLYSGPFLDGFFLSEAPEFEHWIDGERDRLASEFARALETLADEATQRGAHAHAAAHLRRLAAHDPYNSRIALRLMQALRDAGERAAAIQHARVHEVLLRQELELDPDPQVVALAESLRSEPLESRTQAPPAPAPPVERSATEAATHTLSPPHQRAARRVVAAAAVLVITTVAWWATVRARGSDAAPPGAPRSVVVLPFANLSAEPDNEYFSDGMTEELISMLGRVEGLKVASRTSAFAYKNRPLDVREIGKQLGVDAVVEGSVRRSGNALRITAQLVNASNGYRLWSDAFDREAGDLFAVQEEIARAIVTRLSGTLHTTAPATAQGATRNLEAYDLYLRARFAWHQRTRDGLRRAIEYFDQAVALAPDYARAHAGLGDAYAVSAFYDLLPPREAYPKAEAAAARALALDPGLAAAHATMGYVKTYYDLDWPRAEAAFQRAIAADPTYSTAHQWYGNLLTASARFADAEREMRLAQEYDPLSLIASAALGWSLYYAGRHAEALEQNRRTLALDSGYALAHLWGGWALDGMGRSEEARAWISRAVDLSGASDPTRLALAHVLAGLSDGRDSARAIVAEVQARGARGDYVPSYEIGKVHLALGDADQALRWLARSVEERSHSRAFLRVDPQLAPLRSDPRFERLVSRSISSADRTGADVRRSTTPR